MTKIDRTMGSIAKRLELVRTTPMKDSTKKRWEDAIALQIRSVEQETGKFVYTGNNSCVLVDFKFATPEAFATMLEAVSPHSDAEKRILDGAAAQGYVTRRLLQENEAGNEVEQWVATPKQTVVIILNSLERELEAKEHPFGKTHAQIQGAINAWITEANACGITFARSADGWWTLV